MPELRKDPIIGRWVIIAPQRGHRPVDLRVAGATPPENGDCPFCYGQEQITPLEILAYGRQNGAAANEPGWTVRVVPNKFPALRVEGGLAKNAEGIYDRMNGVGAHEVIIETPSHDKRLTDLTDAEVEDVVWAYRDRIIDLARDRRLQYALIFKNEGRAAGATLRHSHSQLIAMPIVPRRVAEELKGAQDYHDYKDRCIYCDIVHQELIGRERIVYENDDFLAVAPYAPRQPFETWVLPKAHDSCFEDGQRKQFRRLANALRVTLKKICLALGNPAYNYILHTAPFGQHRLPHYHWHIEIMPKVTNIAGFEWGSGFYINPTPPEEAAEILRDIEVE